MAHRVCPWFIGYLLASPVRRIWHDPRAIVAPYVKEGMAVLEPGPGMGFFTLELARRVGPAGRVVAIDLQPRMLSALRRRASRAGLADRIDARLAGAGGLGVPDLAGKVGFVLAFAMVHELPDQGRFFSEIAGTLAPGAQVLVAEPSGHVSEAEFTKTLELAAGAGLRERARPEIRRSLTALLGRA